MIDKDLYNPWLHEKLYERRIVNNGKVQRKVILNLIIEAHPRAVESIVSDLEKIGVKVDKEKISYFDDIAFIPITASTELLPKIQEISGIRKIHYDMPKGVGGILELDKMFIKVPQSLIRFDPLLGNITISKIEIPVGPEWILVRNALAISTPAILPLAPVLKSLYYFRFIPYTTYQTRMMILGTDETFYVNNIKVAVLDTGGVEAGTHPLVPAWKNVKLYSTTGEPPQEGQGHGVWVLTCAFGDETQSIHGKIKGVANARNIVSVKCLTNLGFGSTSMVLKAMEIAIKERCKVINMSLGGKLQGSIEDDPETKIIQRYGDDIIFSVAAGNEGSDLWTIGSPAAAPKALTVGAYSPHYKDVAIYSSRGPQAEWYRDHMDKFYEHLRKYGEDFIKVDCMVPGGGPSKSGQKVDLIVSGVRGWFDGFYDLLIDGFEYMRGSSMATPHASGLCAILLEMGKISNAADIKARMRKIADELGYRQEFVIRTRERETTLTVPKDVARGYGLMKLEYFI